MVKVSFNSALGQKDAKKEEEKSEALIPEYRELEDGVRVRRQSRVWCWCMCLGLAVMLSGVVVGGACLYRYLVMQEGQVYFCGVRYLDDDYMIPDDDVRVELPSRLRDMQETIRVLQDEEVELISVPVPTFQDSDPANIVHDFPRRLTAYLDLSLDKCYVIALNTSIVLPPKDLMELLMNVKSGTYLPQSYLIREQMMVTERVENVDQLGYFIYNLCRNKDTYRLQRKDTILGMQKREALNCHKICHFENKFVVETLICEQ